MLAIIAGLSFMLASSVAAADGWLAATQPALVSLACLIGCIGLECRATQAPMGRAAFVNGLRLRAIVLATILGIAVVLWIGA